MTGQDRFRSYGTTPGDCIHQPYIEEKVITENRGGLR